MVLASIFPYHKTERAYTMISRKINGDAFTILLVEDNPAHAELVIRSFEDHRVANKIIHLSDGEAALEYLFQRGNFSDETSSPPQAGNDFVCFKIFTRPARILYAS